MEAHTPVPARLPGTLCRFVIMYSHVPKVAMLFTNWCGHIEAWPIVPGDPPEPIVVLLQRKDREITVLLNGKILTLDLNDLRPSSGTGPAELVEDISDHEHQPC